MGARPAGAHRPGHRGLHRVDTPRRPARTGLRPGVRRCAARPGLRARRRPRADRCGAAGPHERRLVARRSRCRPAGSGVRADADRAQPGQDAPLSVDRRRRLGALDALPDRRRRVQAARPRPPGVPAHGARRHRRRPARGGTRPGGPRLADPDPHGTGHRAQRRRRQHRVPRPRHGPAGRRRRPGDHGAPPPVPLRDAAPLRGRRVRGHRRRLLRPPGPGPVAARQSSRLAVPRGDRGHRDRSLVSTRPRAGAHPCPRGAPEPAPEPGIALRPRWQPSPCSPWGLTDAGTPSRSPCFCYLRRPWSSSSAAGSSPSSGDREEADLALGEAYEDGPPFPRPGRGLG